MSPLIDTSIENPTLSVTSLTNRISTVPDDGSTYRAGESTAYWVPLLEAGQPLPGALLDVEQLDIGEIVELSRLARIGLRGDAGRRDRCERFDRLRGDRQALFAGS